MQYTLAELILLFKMKYLITASKSTFGMIAQSFARKGTWIVKQWADNKIQSLQSDQCQWESISEPEYQTVDSTLFYNTCLTNQSAIPNRSMYMSKTHHKQSKLKFDDGWFHCSISSSADDIDMKNISDNYRWIAIQLPHIEEESAEQSWLYRKQFSWKSDHQVEISFETLNSNFSNQFLTVWLNENEIFSDQIQSSPILIDISNRIIDENTLIILSKNTSFALHVYLLVPKHNSKKKKTLPELPVGKNRVLDYLIRFNDTDGLFEINSTSNLLNVSSNQKINNDADSTKTNVSTSSNTSSILNHLVYSNEFERESPPEIVIHDDDNEELQVPRLTILMMVVGTRGDVQPYVAFGQKLRLAGHRVRLATHEKFRKFVREHDLEFYPIASNPEDLMSYMVKNGGVFPSLTSVIEGDLKRNRRDIKNILESTWLACIDKDDETSIPFTAEVIIANPPSFGHIHCAQKLQIPLHMIFTMPWSPTTHFPHAFCKVECSTTSAKEKLNWVSYDAIETLTWSSTHDIVNRFRRDTLGLLPIHVRQAVRMFVDENVPYTYCWSPSLVPAPLDWPSHINVSGYFFLDDEKQSFKPSDDLVNFLGLNENQEKQKKVSAPLYIGFGSITGNDSDRLLKVILEALKKTNYRALLSGFDENHDELPSNILKISDIPHDWLFQYVSAVCHHGGAGTTAAGLRAGKPSIIVPFFGDQFFWGHVIEKSGAGPKPFPGKEVTVEQLAEAFESAHTPSAREAAERIRDAIAHENGCSTALRMFHSQLPLSRMRSDLESTFAACYRVNEYDLQVSRPVAQVLIAAGALDESQFSPHSTREWLSMYDDRVHLPTSGVLKHTSKAFSHVFIQTAGGMKRAFSGGNLVTGAVTGVSGACKNVGKGVGHLSVGVLSLYGEFTDVLDRFPLLYDRYSELDAHNRPHVTDCKSGVKAAGHAILDGWKDGLTGLVRKPRVGYRRHGILGGANGALIAAANGIVKPTVGSLASVTWLGRGMYASVKKRKRSRTVKENSLINKISAQTAFPALSSTDDEEHEDDKDDDEIPRTIKFAAIVSGYSADVCQDILDKFEQVKKHHERLRISSPDQSNQPRRKRLRIHHRRNSDSAL
ncbi:unnamed protein product [Adineta ricciae]|uniref:Uncharacterized protein n=1 Tax=Adineta ricciae TaxID=249248 RepID=A0A815VEM1_ADIRI|nr:unnamed protein product [Adineta ricciae]